MCCHLLYANKQHFPRDLELCFSPLTSPSSAVTCCYSAGSVHWCFVGGIVWLAVTPLEATWQWSCCTSMCYHAPVSSPVRCQRNWRKFWVVRYNTSSCHNFLCLYTVMLSAQSVSNWIYTTVGSGAALSTTDIALEVTSPTGNCIASDHMIFVNDLLATPLRVTAIHKLGPWTYSQDLCLAISIITIHFCQALTSPISNVFRIDWPKSPPFTHSVPLLRSLHWLPVKFRTVFKISLLICFTSLSTDEASMIKCLD